MGAQQIHRAHGLYRGEAYYFVLQAGVAAGQFDYLGLGGHAQLKFAFGVGDYHGAGAMQPDRGSRQRALLALHYAVHGFVSAGFRAFLGVVASRGQVWLYHAIKRKLGTAGQPGKKLQGSSGNGGGTVELHVILH